MFLQKQSEVLSAYCDGTQNTFVVYRYPQAVYIFQWVSHLSAVTKTNTTIMVTSPLMASMQICEISVLWMITFCGCLVVLLITGYVGYLVAASLAESVHSHYTVQQVYVFLKEIAFSGLCESV